MKIKSRLFDEIDIEESKIIHFENGIIGFPNMKLFSLIYDVEKQAGNISWLQSMDEPEFALPVINPLLIKEDYRPLFNDEQLALLGDINEENSILLSTVTIPGQIEKMSINLKAPIVINGDTKLGAQFIVDEDFPVKYYIYDLLKKGAGE